MRFQEECLEDKCTKKQRINDIEYLHCLYLERCFPNVRESLCFSQKKM